MLQLFAVATMATANISPPPDLNPDGNFVTAVAVPSPAIEETFNFKIAPKWTFSSCVEFAKWSTGNEGKSYGAAGRIKPNSPTPKIGEWLLTKEGPGHAAVIVEIDWANRWLKIDEANWKAGQRTTRWLAFDDPKVRGYFKP